MSNINDVLSIDSSDLNYIDRWVERNIKNPDISKVDFECKVRALNRMALCQIPNSCWDIKISEFDILSEETYQSLIKISRDILQDQIFSQPHSLALCSSPDHTPATSSTRTAFGSYILRVASEVNNDYSNFKYQCLYVQARHLAQWQVVPDYKKLLYDVDYLFIDDYSERSMKINTSAGSSTRDYTVFVNDLLSHRSRYNNKFTIISVDHYSEKALAKKIEEDKKNKYTQRGQMIVELNTSGISPTTQTIRYGFDKVFFDKPIDRYNKQL